MTPSRLHEALILRAHRWRPIPFHPHSKTPAFNEGEIFPYRERPATTDELKHWFADEAMNIGIITGGNHVVLDIDGPEGEQSIKGLPLPDTPTVLAKRGPHYHLQTERPLPTRTKILPGVDIIASDWQVLVPSSTHPDGAQYTWAPDHSLADLQLAPAPAWIYELADLPDDADFSPPTPQTTAAIEQPGSSKHRRESLLDLGESLLDLRQGSPPIPATFPTSITALGGWPVMLEREDVNLRCVGYLGLLSVEIGRKFVCVLPGHPQDHKAASLYWDRRGKAPSGMLKYRDWHYATGDATYNQADVFAARNYHVSRQLKGPEITAWQLRLLICAGVLLPYPVHMRILPREAPRLVKRLYEGYRELLQCKWLHTPGDPAPFTWRFAAAWCGMKSSGYMQEAMTWLLRERYLCLVGLHRPKRGRPMALYLPGDM